MFSLFSKQYRPFNHETTCDGVTNPYCKNEPRQEKKTVFAHAKTKAQIILFPLQR